MITVLLVDDHAIFREGLRSLLERQEGLVVVGETGEAETGIHLVEGLRPDVILMDLDLPGRSGIHATREIVRRWPEARVIALSTDHEPSEVEAAVLAGVRGYLLKDQRLAALVDGIRAVAAGGVAIHPQVGSQLLEDYRRLAAAAGASHIPNGRPSTAAGRNPRSDGLLAPREIEVLERLSTGMSNKQIAEQLCLSEQTIKNLLTRIYHKLGAKNRTEAVLQAVRRRLIEPRT